MSMQPNAKEWDACIARLPLCAQSVSFSNFYYNQLAIASSALFGIAGAGRIDIANLPSPYKPHAYASSPRVHPLIPQEYISLPDGAIECTWSPLVPNILAIACGDGILRVWNTFTRKNIALVPNTYNTHAFGVRNTPVSRVSAVPETNKAPGVNYIASSRPNNISPSQDNSINRIENRAFSHVTSSNIVTHQRAVHTQEVSCVDWSPITPNCLISASWDSSICVYDPQEQNVIHSYPEAHKGCIYHVQFSTHQPNMICSTGADGYIQFYDVRHKKKLFALKVSDAQVLSMDFSRQDANKCVTGASDGILSLYDIRRTSSNQAETHYPPMEKGNNTGSAYNTTGYSNTQFLWRIPAHRLACKRVRFNPINDNFIATASYDTRICIWRNTTPHIQLHKAYTHHAEFVLGLDWSPFDENILSSASWDRHIFIWNALKGPSPPNVDSRVSQIKS